jgi:hypothetical protein
MAEIYPAGTESIRNLTPTFSYFLVVKGDALSVGIPQKEFFVYRYKVPVSKKDGVAQLVSYFNSLGDSTISECREVPDLEYATGIFTHPEYTTINRQPLKFKMRDIPIYSQSQIRVIDLEKDPYQYGSKPIIKDNTAVIIDNQ